MRLMLQEYQVAMQIVQRDRGPGLAKVQSKERNQGIDSRARCILTSSIGRGITTSHYTLLHFRGLFSG